MTSGPGHPVADNGEPQAAGVTSRSGSISSLVRWDGRWHKGGSQFMANLTGKIGIVTGGGSGIGRATAIAMAKAGASLVIGNRDAVKGDEVGQMIRQAGGRD